MAAGGLAVITDFEESRPDKKMVATQQVEANRPNACELCLGPLEDECAPGCFGGADKIEGVSRLRRSLFAPVPPAKKENLLPLSVRPGEVIGSTCISSMEIIAYLRRAQFCCILEQEDLALTCLLRILFQLVPCNPLFADIAAEISPVGDQEAEESGQTAKDEHRLHTFDKRKIEVANVKPDNSNGDGG